MPKSPIRKKKVKKKKSKKEYDDYFDGGYYEVIRKGKNVFTRLKMSKQEHAAWMLQIEENRPKLYEEIKQDIERVKNLINSHDKIYIIAGIASLAFEEMENNPEKDESDPEVSMEYCQSIALAFDNESTVIPTKEVLQKIYELIKKIRNDFKYYYLFENVNKQIPDVQAEIRAGMISESLYIRGEGYLKHIKELFAELFSSHDTFFQKHFGFNSGDIIKTIEDLEYSFRSRLTSKEGKPNPIFLNSFRKWQLSENNTPQSFLQQNPGFAIENGMPALYYVLEISSFEKLYRIRHLNEVQKKVVEVLSLKFGDNTEFGNCEILNDSKIFSYPIVQGKDENYYLFSMYLGARNYIRIAMNLIRQADLGYYNKSFLNNRVLISKDNFIERKVKTLFEKMLPGAKFYPNVKYNYPTPNVDIKCAKALDGNYELDILGISENATYFIEVKSGLLNEKAKRGALLTLHSDLTKLIGDAICQSYRAYRFALDNEDSFFTSCDLVQISPINRKNVYRISVSFSYMGGLISSLDKLQQFGVIENNVEFAWAVNIYDLMAFSEIIDSEQEFIDYLDRRIPLYQDKRLTNLDETALLGLFYEDDLNIHKDLKNTDTVSLNSRSYMKEIDAFFDKGGDKPKKKQSYMKRKI
ncbi:hypothetical protein [Ferruginibacter albus]|uniref:hypothetical protein n=1 Tax=Ferruginibacter albus TaxID=2875540 RepID=UPI001CC72278|nr:hypothetical protein [Ferruginibacter albus]UAY53176.1 hypothetical protein K9M53_05770 [Ferruginibacter albus]